MNSNTTHSISNLSGEVFDSLPNSIRSHIRYLETTIQQLQARVHDLENRLSKNSSNSNKPPGSDSLKKKPKSLRGKSGKKPGAQQGHVGKGLAQVKNPDMVVTHVPINCNKCEMNLSEVEGCCVERRQVFELPQPEIEVTEHQALQSSLLPISFHPNF